jgi:very-short-patch-repair endonuclease
VEDIIMIIFRCLLTQTIRNGQLQLRHIVQASESEILELSSFSVKKVAQEFYSQFQNSREFQRTNKVIISRVKQVIDETSLANQITFLKIFTVACDKGAEIDCEMILKGLELLASRNFEQNPSDLNLISRFVAMAVVKNINCDKYLQEYIMKISPSCFSSFSDNFLTQFSSLLQKRASLNKFFNIEYPGCRSLYQVLETEINKRLETMPISLLTTHLKMFISTDHGSEDFIRKIETRIFTNLDQIDEKYLVDLASFNKSRYLHNVSYIANYISKPLYLEFTSRFETLTPLTKSLFLLNYWKNSFLYGMFTDETLQLKLEKFLKNKENFLKLDKKTRNFLLLNIFSYLSHSRQVTDSIFKDLESLYLIFFSSFDTVFHLRLLTYMVREKSFPDSMFFTSLSSISTLEHSEETSSQLYSIYLNLKYRHPSKLSFFIKALPAGETLENIEKKWKKNRMSDLLQARGSHLHREVENLLREKQVSFISEFYDDYFIDIVIPQLKIALEISGPGHFLHPGFKLNGKSYNKQEILKAKGWQVYSFSYYSSKSLASFLSSILPLDF